MKYAGTTQVISLIIWIQDNMNFHARAGIDVGTNLEKHSSGSMRHEYWTMDHVERIYNTRYKQRMLTMAFERVGGKGGVVT